MGIKLRFDSTNNVESPTFILGTRSGVFIGGLPAYKIAFTDALKDASEISFSINKKSCVDKSNNYDRAFWDKIKSFKTLYCKDFDRWYELQVEVNEHDSTIKNVTAASLGKAELSQIYLYGYEINTEADIARDDYSPSVLYDVENPESSILHRILKRAPHYRIEHVDESISSIQRTFQFDGKTIDQAFGEISEEIDCLIEYECKAKNEFGGIDRIINVYDLECICLDCGTRGAFADACSNCGGHNLKTGYGEDTSIYVSKENLADEITYEVDADSVKNAFRLEGGDDLMTATISACNPNGSAYIWYISDDMREDMSDELREKLSAYDLLYAYYQNEYVFSPDEELVSAYNSVVEKYREMDDTLRPIDASSVGYQNLMKNLYDTIDLELFLRNRLMPAVSVPTSDASDEANKLIGDNIVAVTDVSKCTLSTATSAVETWTKSVIRNTYKAKASSASYDNGVWSGDITVTNVADSTDTATVTISAVMTSDPERQIRQRIDAQMSKQSDQSVDIKSLFELSSQDFKSTIMKYCMNRLLSLRDACQSVLDILIQQGAANNESGNSDLYNSIYIPYRAKLDYLDDEIAVREREIGYVVGVDGATGMRNAIDNERLRIQSELDFESYVGEELWVEFSAYCREDSYKNDNYISDGLDNDAIFSRAQEFLETARKEIYSSATSQHLITAKLKNLLSMHEFSPITRHFSVGNWIRVEIDGTIYRLRLIGYQLDFNDIASLSVEFSDICFGSSCMSDLQDILRQSSSMATSYGSVKRQAGQGKQGATQIKDWIADGLALTNMKIVDDADNQSIVYDNHGLLGREYIPYLDQYDGKQIKLINSGLYMTDDNWRTCKVALGQIITADGDSVYGINAENVMGKMIVGNTMRLLDSSGNDMFVVIDGKIESAIGSVNSRLTQIEQTEANVAIRVSSLEETKGIANQVTTTTGYTFDADGMRVSKSGEEIENLIKNDGMYVNRGADNLLTVNNNGVDAMNITTRQYLIIGETARFEPYGSDRTGCFYIDG